MKRTLETDTLFFCLFMKDLYLRKFIKPTRKGHIEIIKIEIFKVKLLLN